jgi:hypothetical protein
LPGVSLEELEVAMLTSRSRCSNDVKICVGRASVAALSLLQTKNVAQSIITMVLLTLNGVKLCCDLWTSKLMMIQPRFTVGRLDEME